MPYTEFQNNWKIFLELIEELQSKEEENVNQLIKRYIEQNLLLLNDVFANSIEYLKKLQKANTANEIICTQAVFTTEMSKRLSISSQRFLNDSLNNISDYNDLLKSHCDFATD